MLGKKTYLLRNEIRNTHTLPDTVGSDAVASLFTMVGRRNLQNRSPNGTSEAFHIPAEVEGERETP